MKDNSLHIILYDTKNSLLPLRQTFRGVKSATRANQIIQKYGPGTIKTATWAGQLGYKQTVEFSGAGVRMHEQHRPVRELKQLAETPSRKWIEGFKGQRIHKLSIKH